MGIHVAEKQKTRCYFYMWLQDLVADVKCKWLTLKVNICHLFAFQLPFPVIKRSIWIKFIFQKMCKLVIDTLDTLRYKSIWYHIVCFVQDT